ncbi:hypothetical protein [Corynebacterium uterequi]|uniref:Uncharacterized protein n=1 Tax=Corynebacterium uterequi TaxID=1072256 RepID=A0A0G3HE64_9CORY|nr:hypothetical protein [Corynebacterium uterequi]AKK10233.1 hypothetical protein CUTER_01065 [Corynebacterium uterequi]
MRQTFPTPELLLAAVSALVAIVAIATHAEMVAYWALVATALTVGVLMLSLCLWCAPRRVATGTILLGVVLTIAGAIYGAAFMQPTEIFSPVLMLPLGIVLVVSGGLTLLRRRSAR